MAFHKKSIGATTLTKEVKELRISVDSLSFIVKQTSQFRRALSRSFLTGVVSAIGAMVAVVIVTPLVIWSVQRVVWPPLIAELVAKVIFQYEQMNRQSPPVVDGR